MPKIQIDLPSDAYNKLKQNAKLHYQSLRAYVTYTLVQYANNQMIDISQIPENTTIRTKTPVQEKTKAPHRDLIKEAYEKEGIFEGRVHSADDEPFTNEEYIEEINRSYPYCQTHPDFIILKQYYDSFTSTPEEMYEARERFVGLPHFYELQAHEESYLYQTFDFTPPGDEPTLDLMTYITRLAQGGWYDDDTTQHIKYK